LTTRTNRKEKHLSGAFTLTPHQRRLQYGFAVPDLRSWFELQPIASIAGRDTKDAL
jgi:hypothetical protein